MSFRKWTRLICSTAAIGVVGRGADAQTTTCVGFSNGMTCNTMQPPPPPSQTDWAAFGRSFRSALDARRQRQQAREYRAVASAQEAAAYKAELKRQSDESERNAAMQRLFIERWVSVVKQLGDSLGVTGEIARRTDARITPTAVDLYRVNPQASSAQMREALQPHVVFLGGQYIDFLRTIVAVSQPSLDSLRLNPSETQVFMAAARPMMQTAFMMAPDQSPAEFQSNYLGPLLTRAHVYFDSLRTITVDSLRRVAPTKRTAASRPRP